MALAIHLPHLFVTHQVSDLSTYMLDTSRWQDVEKQRTEYVHTIAEDVDTVVVTDPVVPEKPADTLKDRIDRFTVFSKGAFDTLFWSMYLVHYGNAEYFRVGVNNGKEEMKEKNKIVDYFRTHSSTYFNAFSNYKITKTFIDELSTDLLTCGKMKWSGLVAMSLFYQCNIYIVDYTRNIYLPFITGNATHTYVLYQNPHYIAKHRNGIQYFVDPNTQVLSIEALDNTMIQLVNYNKPLRGVSTYKMSDLEEMAEKVGVELDDDDGKLLRKQELYNKILVKTVWEIQS